MATEIAGLTEDQIAERRAAPNWPQPVALAPTMAREARIEEGWDWQPDRFTGIAVPTLLITGSETPPELAEVTSMIAAAIPGARVHVLAGTATSPTYLTRESSPRCSETGSSNPNWP
jgi:pimeloyl-ACP methyl ester carboxylesterase